MPMPVSTLCVFLMSFLLINHTISTDPSGNSLAPISEPQYDNSLPPQYPEAYAPVYEEPVEDDVSQEISSPPPYPANDVVGSESEFEPEDEVSNYDSSLTAPVPAPSMAANPIQELPSSPPNAEALAPELNSEPEDDDYVIPLAILSPAPAPATEVAYDDSVADQDQTQMDSQDTAEGEEDDSTVYRAEDEIGEYEPEEYSSGYKHSGVILGVIVGFCVVGLAGFVYKRKKEDKRVEFQYQSLAKKTGV